ncbi:MAG TPA: F0F1 ATP synthase subunit epsilon [Candidatus Saccharimonadales bacterium]|jgi:F-type H+-transporting ATPase subunit epsilon|nr:F0F1 ATP synthase subunit epsilon [Candidatus Saccharimonadales bacterium]
MLPEAIELIIVTPERQLLRQTVTEIQVPGADGFLGILPGHAPLITELGIGELTYHTKDGKQSDPIAILSGFAEVLPDKVTILAETAELAAEIDLERARKALVRAQERLASVSPEIDWDRATVALSRALVRVKLGEYVRKRGTSAVAHN